MYLSRSLASVGALLPLGDHSLNGRTSKMSLRLAAKGGRTTLERLRGDDGSWRHEWSDCQ